MKFFSTEMLDRINWLDSRCDDLQKENEKGNHYGVGCINREIDQGLEYLEEDFGITTKQLNSMGWNF